MPVVSRLRDTSESFSTRWITLGQACKLLGVNESTLRRWADAGHVRSFRTPGGHRRFSEEDLRALVAGRGGAGGEPYTSLGQLALSRIRRRLQRGRTRAPWYSGMSEEERERMRPLGRRLVDLVSEYMTKGARRSQLIDEAREIGHEYGKELVGDRLSIRDAVEAFAFFRKGLDDAAMELAQKNDLSAEEAVEVWELLSNLADQVLLAIAEVYEQAETPAATAN
jgi:excisionase family DNA binding protein